MRLRPHSSLLPQTFFFTTLRFSPFLFAFFMLSLEEVRKNPIQVCLCFHAVLVGQKVQQGVFHVKKMLARAFSGWFSSVRLRQGQVVEG